jgi:KEOPS complex subunit Pcc1
MNVCEACFTFTPEKARIIADSLKPEEAVSVQERSKTSITAEGSILKVTINAEDLHALRAAVNTHFKWVLMASELLK